MGIVAQTGDGIIWVYICFGLIALLLPVALIRWVLRIDEIVKNQKIANQRLEEIRAALTAQKAAGNP